MQNEFQIENDSILEPSNDFGKLTNDVSSFTKNDTTMITKTNSLNSYHNYDKHNKVKNLMDSNQSTLSKWEIEKESHLCSKINDKNNSTSTTSNHIDVTPTTIYENLIKNPILFLNKNIDSTNKKSTQNNVYENDLGNQIPFKTNLNTKSCTKIESCDSKNKFPYDKTLRPNIDPSKFINYNILNKSHEKTTNDNVNYFNTFHIMSPKQLIEETNLTKNKNHIQLKKSHLIFTRDFSPSEIVKDQETPSLIWLHQVSFIAQNLKLSSLKIDISTTFSYYFYLKI